MAKSKSGSMGIIYSTDASFKYEEENQQQITLAPPLQKLKVRLETKHRGGKVVTLVEGFVGTHEDVEEIGKKLKSFCGSGGSVKAFEILIQGNNKDKILNWLIKNGYSLSKKI